MSNNKQIQTIKSYTLAKPQEVKQMAIVLKDYIVKNNLSVKIVNKDYVMVEGWQFAGGLLGLMPRIVKVEKLDEMKWLAQAEIINSKTGQVVSTGYALCSKSESKKASFDEYALLSMAQTRAIGKAYRNLIGWVVKMSGFEATPAEEMKQEPIKQAPKTMSQKEAYDMASNKIDSCNDKKELNEMLEKLCGKQGEVFSQTKRFELIEKINEKLGTKK